MAPHFLRGLIVICTATAIAGCVSSEVRQLADASGTNVGLVSTMLTNHQKGINQIAIQRIDLIGEVERVAAEARMEADREIAILKASGGSDVVKVLDALREHADKAAMAPAQLDAVQAQAKKDASSVYQPLTVPTEKLDGVAKSLASLGKDQTDGERIVFLFRFFKEVRQDGKNQTAQSEASKDGADNAEKKKVTTVQTVKKN